MIDDMRMEWRELDRRVSALDDEFAEHARTDETAGLLSTIPGLERFECNRVSRRNR
jgi:hypothetical protein